MPNKIQTAQDQVLTLIPSFKTGQIDFNTVILLYKSIFPHYNILNDPKNMQVSVSGGLAGSPKTDPEFNHQLISSLIQCLNIRLSKVSGNFKDLNGDYGYIKFRSLEGFIGDFITNFFTYGNRKFADKTMQLVAEAFYPQPAQPNNYIAKHTNNHYAIYAMLKHHQVSHETQIHLSVFGKGYYSLTALAQFQKDLSPEVLKNLIDKNLYSVDKAIILYQNYKTPEVINKLATTDISLIRKMVLPQIQDVNVLAKAALKNKSPNSTVPIIFKNLSENKDTNNLNSMRFTQLIKNKDFKKIQNHAIKITAKKILDI